MIYMTILGLISLLLYVVATGSILQKAVFGGELDTFDSALLTVCIVLSLSLASILGQYFVPALM